MWLARDKDNTLYFHGISKPKKDIKRGIWKSDELTPYFINPNFSPKFDGQMKSLPKLNL